MVQSEPEVKAVVQDEEPDPKRRKSADAKPAIKQEVVADTPQVKSERCNICRQYTEDILLYNGHPNNSVEEYIALTDEKLMLFTGDEEELHQQDERPTNKVNLIIIIFI